MFFMLDSAAGALWLHEKMGAANVSDLPKFLCLVQRVTYLSSCALCRGLQPRRSLLPQLWQLLRGRWKHICQQCEYRK